MFFLGKNSQESINKLKSFFCVEMRYYHEIAYDKTHLPVSLIQLTQYFKKIYRTRVRRINSPDI